MVDTNNKRIVVNADFSMNIEQGLSSLFSKARIRIMHYGHNVNRSYFEKQSVIEALDTMKNVPIVGYFMEEEENFGGHELNLEIEDNEIVQKTKTVPIGVVPESATFSWEEVVDEDGITREYLVADNALIWNRDKKLVNALKSDSFGQSMEIGIDDGYMDNGVNHINKFHFTALCVLGIDKDGAGYVKPAFANAKIQTYEHDDSQLSKGIEGMFKDLKFALDEIKNIQEGETKLKLEELLTKFSLSDEAELATIVANYSEIPVEDVEKELEAYATAKEAEAKAKAEEDAKAKSKGAGKDGGAGTDSKDKKIKSLEDEVARLKAENDSLKVKIEELKGDKAKFEAENHARECEEKVKAFSAQFGLAEELVQGLDFSTFESIDQLETKLFEILGRSSKPVAKDEANKKADFSKIAFEAQKGGAGSSEFGFEALFNK